MTGRYEELHTRSISDPEGFWGDASREIDWIKPWEQVYAKVDGLDRWFIGAECNTCWNAIDRHVAAGQGARTALIYDSAMRLGQQYRQALRPKPSIRRKK